MTMIAGRMLTYIIKIVPVAIPFGATSTQATRRGKSRSTLKALRVAVTDISSAECLQA
jgi:hypothetical protein